MKVVSRVEHKFFINEFAVPALIEILDKLMYRDPNSADSGHYKISSLYFDDEYDTDLTDKLDGVRYREKYRVRIYNDDQSFGKFEIKRKEENTIFKSSTSLNENLIHSICNNNMSCLKAIDHLAYVYAKMKYKNYRPKSIVTYERTAFYLPYDNIRVTLDVNLRTHGFVDTTGLDTSNGRGISIIPKGYQILEIKYENELPDYLKSVITEFQLSKTSISKYAASRLHSSTDLQSDEPYFAF